ncbi:hypothetical protein CROQUDRAFT_682711 [Cronartium quercuum f. sp. fusiforme G11]|uniref:Secreted protein n=1 Tax=Cronartium quercuum f. sp. fusiforme G11 TaxID=708437 RepID=A0A9P6NTR7_9BASI|nr:hypothetical protein CROQUDRAFT_682711 [Cronartium quercuum f. sp. fusiforme G11]
MPLNSLILPLLLGPSLAFLPPVFPVSVLSQLAVGSATISEGLSKLAPLRHRCVLNPGSIFFDSSGLFDLSINFQSLAFHFCCYPLLLNCCYSKTV